MLGPHNKNRRHNMKSFYPLFQMKRKLKIFLTFHQIRCIHGCVGVCVECSTTKYEIYLPFWSFAFCLWLSTALSNIIFFTLFTFTPIRNMVFGFNFQNSSFKQNISSRTLNIVFFLHESLWPFRSYSVGIKDYGLISFCANLIEELFVWWKQKVNGMEQKHILCDILWRWKTHISFFWPTIKNY